MAATLKKLKLEELGYPSVFDKTITQVKYVLLDSVYCGNQLDTVTKEEEVFTIVRKNLKLKTKGTFHNYIISREGTIYSCVSPTYAGRCDEDVYSEKACTLFPNTCPLTDNRVTPHIVRPDTELISICTVSEPDSTLGSVDSGKMSQYCEESLKKLLSYVMCKGNVDDTTRKLTSNNIILRSIFPGLSSVTRGHVYYRDNPTKFLILKRYIDHALISEAASYPTNLVTVDTSFTV